MTSVMHCHCQPALVCAVSAVQAGSLTECCNEQSMYRGAPLTPVKKSCHTSSIGAGTTQVTCTDRQTDRQTDRHTYIHTYSCRMNAAGSQFYSNLYELLATEET